MNWRGVLIWRIRMKVRKIEEILRDLVIDVLRNKGSLIIKRMKLEIS